MGSLEASEICEHDVVELALTLTGPSIHDVPIVDIDHDGPSANAIRSHSGQNVRGPAMASSEGFKGCIHSPSFVYSSLILTDAARIHYGDNIYNNFKFDNRSRAENQSLFDDLTLSRGRFADQQSAQITKARYRAARAVSGLVSSSVSIG